MNYDRMSDLEIARYLVCSIPAGRWTNYGEIADAIDALSPGRELNAASNPGWRVAMTLLPLPSDAAPWHRLRNKDGVYVPPGSPPNAKERQREMDDRLRAEGCRVDMTGFADPRNWIGERELVRLAMPAEQRAQVEEAEHARRERVRRELEERRARQREAEAQRRAWLKRKRPLSGSGAAGAAAGFDPPIDRGRPVHLSGRGSGGAARHRHARRRRRRTGRRVRLTAG